MLYGIISDIHGNLEALESVLDSMGSVDQLICLGDIVGYGANPNECCDLIKEFKAASVIGNHDMAVIGHQNLEWFNDWARSSIIWTRQKLKQRNVEFLQSHPQILKLSREITITHGSLKDPVHEYVTDKNTALTTIDLMKTPLCFIGHTHLSEVYFSVNTQNKLSYKNLSRGGKIETSINFRSLINCGSVGQPRDGNSKASFGIYDSELGIVRIKKIGYNIAAAAEKILNAGMPPILAERLYLGQ